MHTYRGKLNLKKANWFICKTNQDPSDMSLSTSHKIMKNKLMQIPKNLEPFY